MPTVVEGPKKKFRIGRYETSIHTYSIKDDEFISEPPIGFENLKPGAIKNILRYAGLPENDPGQLELLTARQLKNLANSKDKFGPNGDISMCIPDRGESIRTALKLRASLVIKAAVENSNYIPGSQDTENLRQAINAAKQKKKKNIDDNYPF